MNSILYADGEALAAFPHSIETARSASALADTFGMNPRRFRLYTRSLRLSGVPLVAGNAGMWITDDPEELMKYALRQYHIAQAHKQVGDVAMQNCRNLLLDQADLRQLRSLDLEPLDAEATFTDHL